MIYCGLVFSVCFHCSWNMIEVFYVHLKIYLFILQILFTYGIYLIKKGSILQMTNISLNRMTHTIFFSYLKLMAIYNRGSFRIDRFVRSGIRQTCATWGEHLLEGNEIRSTSHRKHSTDNRGLSSAVVLVQLNLRGAVQLRLFSS